VIRVHKSNMPPAILRNRGRTATETLCAAFDVGETEFDFDNSLYAATSVKKALRKAQHDKCAFCESKVSHIAYGDVEHFRPKAGWVQRDGDALTRPGYYWLAYEWANLFYSCQLCNQRFKKNLFPLEEGSLRARSHHADPADEKPLLIDPGREEPERNLGFRAEIAYPVDDSAKGQTTIDVLGLNRPELTEVRRDRLRTFRLLLRTLREWREQEPTPLIRSQIERLEAELEKWIQDGAEYAAMMRAARDEEVPRCNS
jgi:uncharacterized protein (TIGR02646 family)